jgi:hypothetical protein
LLAGGTVTAVDFGTTALHEGYPIVSGARVTFAAHITQRLRDSGVLELAGDLGIDVAADETGSVTLVTPMPDGAEEWISQNCALRELVSDVLENAVDPIGYRYRTIADALPDLIELEPRVYTRARSGALEVRARIVSTPAERTWESEIEADRRQTLHLFVDRLPRPGDYLDVNFALYRFVRIWDDAGTPCADTVLERVKEPSRN